MKKLFLGLLLTLLSLSCSENPTASRDTTATIRNNSDFTVTCQVIMGVDKQTFTLTPSESRSVKAPELPYGLKVTFPNGTTFTGFIAAGDVITITNSGVRRN